MVFCVSAVWGGAKLTDVLELIGVPKLTSVTPLGGKHIEFVSIDKCKVILLAFILLSRNLSFFKIFPSTG